MIMMTRRWYLGRRYRLRLCLLSTHSSRLVFQRIVVEPQLQLWPLHLHSLEQLRALVLRKVRGGAAGMGAGAPHHACPGGRFSGASGRQDVGRRRSLPHLMSQLVSEGARCRASSPSICDSPVGPIPGMKALLSQCLKERNGRGV
jgi:hypothetical protein